MKYALVLENSTKTCNDTSAILASMGYLVTPVFSPKKALHAAHMIQFDLIITCTATIPGDRRSLTGELARCSPDAILVLLVDPDTARGAEISDGVSAVLERPLTARELDAVLEAGLHGPRMPPPQRRSVHERRRRAVD